MKTPELAAKLLIIVPCLNEERHLPALLAWLLREAGRARIVVADGGSTDASRAIVEDLARGRDNLLLLDNPAQIQAAGINRAIAEAAGEADWLVRIDAHSSYPDGYVGGLLAAADRTGATSVVVPMVTRAAGCFQRAAAAAQNSVIGTGGSPHRHLGAGRFVDHGHHALMRLDLFRAVGGYREDMPANEDAELDARLVAAGGCIWLEPSLAIGYFPRATPGALWRQYFAFGRGRAHTLRLHHRRPRLRQVLPLGVVGAATLALLAPLWPPLALPLAAWGVAILIAGAIVGLRAGGGCAVFAGAAAMIMHLSWGLGFLVGWRRPLVAYPAAEKP